MYDDGAFTIGDFCAWANVGRTFTYDLINRGLLKAVKIGGKTLVPKTEARAWLSSLPAITPRASKQEAA
jgi:excisionase family DNA binding protein